MGDEARQRHVAAERGDRRPDRQHPAERQHPAPQAGAPFARRLGGARFLLLVARHRARGDLEGDHHQDRIGDGEEAGGEDQRRHRRRQHVEQLDEPHTDAVDDRQRHEDMQQPRRRLIADRRHAPLRLARREDRERDAVDHRRRADAGHDRRDEQPDAGRIEFEDVERPLDAGERQHRRGDIDQNDARRLEGPPEIGGRGERGIAVDEVGQTPARRDDHDQQGEDHRSDRRRRLETAAGEEAEPVAQQIAEAGDRPGRRPPRLDPQRGIDHGPRALDHVLGETGAPLLGDRLDDLLGPQEQQARLLGAPLRLGEELLLFVALGGDRIRLDRGGLVVLGGGRRTELLQPRLERRHARALGLIDLVGGGTDRIDPGAHLGEPPVGLAVTLERGGDLLDLVLPAVETGLDLVGLLRRGCRRGRLRRRGRGGGHRCRGGGRGGRGLDRGRGHGRGRGRGRRRLRVAADGGREEGETADGGEGEKAHTRTDCDRQGSSVVVGSVRKESPRSRAALTGE